MISARLPPPPEELEPDQQLEWEAITARLPVDWFTGENIPMLKELCRHITYARELAGQIAEGEASRGVRGVAADTAAETGKSNAGGSKRDGKSCADCCARTATSPNALGIFAPSCG